MFWPWVPSQIASQQLQSCIVRDKLPLRRLTIIFAWTNICATLFGHTPGHVTRLYPQSQHCIRAQSHKHAEINQEHACFANTLLGWRSHVGSHSRQRSFSSLSTCRFDSQSLLFWRTEVRSPGFFFFLRGSVWSRNEAHQLLLEYNS